MPANPLKRLGTFWNETVQPREGAAFAALLAIGLAIAAGAAAVRLAGAWKGVAPLSDDAFYYFITARNFVDLGYFTFDRINETNGFHPLWMWISVAVYWIIGTGASLPAQLAANTAAECALFLSAAGMCAAFARSLRKRGNPFAYAFLALFAALVYPGFNWPLLLGMETMLAAALSTAALYCLVVDARAALAVLFPLLFLARLDLLVFAIAPVLVYYGLRNDVSLKTKAAMAAPVAAAFLAYSLHNWLKWGSVTPVSGALKSTFPVPRPELSHFLDPVLLSLATGDALWWLTHANLLIISAILLAGMAAATRTASALDGGRPGKAVLILSIAALLTANLFLFQKWNKNIESWYLGLPAAMAVFAAAAAFAPLLRDWRKAAFYLGCLGVLGLSSLHLAKDALGVLRAERNPSGVEAFIANETPPDAVFSATDCGRLSFWTGRRFVNLDGLINNFEYQDYLQRGGLADYFGDKGIDYLVVHVHEEPFPHERREPENMYVHRINREAYHSGGYTLPFKIYSYLHGRFSDAVELTAEREVYRSEPRVAGGVNNRYLVFRTDNLGAGRISAAE